jgi:hypothetical protein
MAKAPRKVQDEALKEAAPSAAQYRVRVSRMVSIGGARLKPGAPRIVVDAATLAELQAQDALVDYEEMPPFVAGVTV